MLGSSDVEIILTNAVSVDCGNCFNLRENYAHIIPVVPMHLMIDGVKLRNERNTFLLFFYTFQNTHERD